MKGIVAITACLAGMGLASANMITANKNAAATAIQSTTNPPLCKFDPVKGEYVCPDASRILNTADGVDATTKDTAAAGVAAADCHKCQHDWTECIKVGYTYRFTGS